MAERTHDYIAIRHDVYESEFKRAMGALLDGLYQGTNRIVTHDCGIDQDMTKLWSNTIESLRAMGYTVNLSGRKIKVTGTRYTR